MAFVAAVMLYLTIRLLRVVATVMRYVVPSSSSVSLCSILEVVLLSYVSPEQLVLKYEMVYEVAVTSSSRVQEMVIDIVETETTDRNNASERGKTWHFVDVARLDTMNLFRGNKAWTCTPSTKIRSLF